MGVQLVLHPFFCVGTGSNDPSTHPFPTDRTTLFWTITGGSGGGLTQMDRSGFV